MKYFILLLNLIVITSSYASSIVFPTILRRDVSVNQETLLSNFSEECAEEDKNSEYSIECMSPVTINNWKQTCSNIYSEKCQKFYIDEDKTKYYPICSKIPQFNELFKPLVFKNIVQKLELNCQTDENNELCPFSIYGITQTGGDKALDDTCKSKKCTEELLNIYKNVSMDQLAAYENLSYTNGSLSYEELSVAKRLVSELESEECKSKHVTSDIYK